MRKRTYSERQRKWARARVVSVQLEPSEKARLEAKAREQGTTVAGLIRRYIRLGLFEAS